jgi:aminoglycoside phosphotransferase family enzyme
MLEMLQTPDPYPESTERVRLVQTHISWVFICDQFVYKLKKPVDFGFLDFTTLEKRKHFCQQEVELNRRLAKDVYLGVYSVIFEGNRFKILEDPNNTDPVEYAVKMRVIPDEVLMKNRYERGALTPDDMTRAAETIADFHASAARSTEIDKFGELSTVKFNTDENFEQTQGQIGNSITEEQFNALKQWTDEFYQKHAGLLKRRISAGRVRDCHGDLHMEHICFTDPITIIDCIEFNDRFRYSDTASDLAFLLMDLEYHNGDEFAKQLSDSYMKYSGEGGPEFEMILKYYKVYRAYVRGKVNSFQLGDPSIPVAKKNQAKHTAQRYFELAYRYIND